MAVLSSTLDNIRSRLVVTKSVNFNKYKHKKNPWMTQGIMISIKYRDRLFRRLRKTPADSLEHAHLKTNLATYNGIIKKSIRQAKASYYQTTFTNAHNDPKQTWKHINAILNRTSSDDSLPPGITLNGRKISNKQMIVNSFNEHFASIGKKLTNSLGDNQNNSFESYLTDNVSSNFSFQQIDCQTVSKIIDQLACKTTTAADGISTKLLKNIRDQISEPLCHILNQSFYAGIFPDALKVARVKALFKKGDRCDLNNYRPISILPSLSKVFEKAMLKQMSEYFTHNDLFFNGQYGFREKHSTELAALELVDRISKAMDAGLTPFSIFIDLSKAFDCLNHEILISKLRFYGIQNSALTLIQSYLQNRKQFVQSEDLKSDTANLDTGVPQGSILGPFLFLVFMNDFHHSTSRFQMVNYADDTTLLSNISSFSSVLSGGSVGAELERVNDWLLANKMCINVKKTKLMYFSPRSKQINFPDVSLNGVVVEVVEDFNYLGIVLDKHLTWQKHVDSVHSKLSKVCGILAKIKHLVPQTTLKTIYNSLMACRLHYGILVWGKSSNKLFKIQKKAIRIITNSSFNAHTEPLFKSNNILKVNDLRKLHELKFFFKFHHNTLPSYFLNGFIEFNDAHHAYATRHHGNLATPLFRHEYFRNNLRYCIVGTINNCPPEIKDKIFTHSFSGFSSYAKHWMLSNYHTNCEIPNCYVCRNH